MNKCENKISFITDYFKKHNPNASSELIYKTPFQLLVSVILSAQCTDKRVNLITPALFEKYSTAEEMAIATIDDIFSYIKSISYPNSKAKYLSLMSKKLVSDFSGNIPDTVEALTSLSGVGRKTANVILSVLFSKPAMAVDTHVFRVSHRLKIVSDSANTPEKVEKELIALFPKKLIGIAHHWLILHGRYVCTATSPKCNDCGLFPICDGIVK